MGSVHLRPFLTMVLVFALAGAATADARPLAVDDTVHRGSGGMAADTEFVPGQVIVQFRSDASATSRARALSARGASSVRSLARPGLTLVRLRGDASVRAAVAAFERDPSVEFAEPNYLYQVLGPPNDPDFDELWGLHNPVGDHDIDAPEAWDKQTGSATVVVAVIDSGVAYDHPELNDNIWTNDDPPNGLDDDGNGKLDDTRGWDFIQNDNTPLDFNGHGTHVAGTIGAEGNNGADIAGVNWDVSIMPVRAGNAYGSLPGSAILNAIKYACAERADIVNGSFGGAGKSTALANAIKSNACKNTLFVFAAGNDGHVLNNNTAATNTYPCEYWRAAPHGFGATNLVCVAATNMNDALASFSNRGKSAVHLAAPGVDIYSSVPQWSSVFSDDLEANFNNWTGAGGTAAWQRTSELSDSGSFSMTDSPGGLYPNSADITIRNMAALNLTNRSGCAVAFNVELLIRDVSGSTAFDYLAVEGATSSGGPWQNDGVYAGTTNGDFLSGFDDMSRLDGQATAYVRFRLHSSGSIRDGGAHVDDVVVECLTTNGEEYAVFDGSSMASPHVAGVAALLLAQEPAMTPQQLKNAILKGVDKKTGLANHVLAGGRLNANNSLRIAMDHVAPTTRITARPPGSTRSRKATFRFVSNEPGSTFRCRHMSGAWRACSSPKTYSGLGTGMHTFRVRAIDKNGNVDATPAIDTWRIRP